VSAGAGEELVDVVDDADRVVARQTRAAVRRNNLLHRAVYVFVLNHTGHLFVHQRTATKDVYPGHRDVAIGGVPYAGEDYATAATREVAEELGMTGVALEPLFTMRYADAVTRINGMVFRCVHDGPFRLQAEEIVAGEFVPLAEVARLRVRERFCPDGLVVFDRFCAEISRGALPSVPPLPNP
jgi:isopentenyldiphosphate isomerase